jgi:hypothetical protein
MISDDTEIPRQEIAPPSDQCSATCRRTYLEGNAMLEAGFVHRCKEIDNTKPCQADGWGIKSTT